MLKKILGIFDHSQREEEQQRKNQIEDEVLPDLSIEVCRLAVFKACNMAAKNKYNMQEYEFKDVLSRYVHA